MRWATLFNIIGKQPLKFTRKENVYALLWDKQKGRTDRIYLTVKYDAYGRPYFIRDEKAQKIYERDLNAKSLGSRT